jgi:hypothetical protein
MEASAPPNPKINTNTTQPARSRAMRRALGGASHGLPEARPA